LSARCLQKTGEASIYKNTENREIFNILKSHNYCQKGACKNRLHYY